MGSSKKKFDEDALRQKIREKLEQEHSVKQNKKAELNPFENLAKHEEDESFFLEVYVRRQLQEEVYSKYPEFVKCGNHLDQIRWLTPLEMENEFEFFPIEYGFWRKLSNKFKTTKVSLPKTPEIKKMIDEFRQELEKDAADRVEKYRSYIKDNPKNLLDDLEKKIFEEEQDRFYRSLKGYHKYKNHLGETTWLSHDEFENQEEYIDRVYSTREKVSRGVVFSLAIIMVITAIYLLVNQFQTESPKGYIIVNISESKGSLYIDQKLAVGFTPGVAYPLNEGTHNITVLATGFKTEPVKKNIDLGANDTVRIDFNLVPLIGKMGVVRLSVPFLDAGIYVDGEFLGNVGQNKLLSIPEGDHTITVKRDNYITVPAVRTFTINVGDTLDLAFRLNPTKSILGDQLNSGTNFGLIEINSNIRGAEIVLNGQRTGFGTDYVLQKIPLGQHVIRLEKEGYKVYPNEHVVRLTRDERQSRINFTLTSTTKLVTIITHPKSATIFINGKEAGIGRFNGSLALGQHKITFSNEKGYQNPGLQLIDVIENGADKFEFRFGSDLFFEITPSGSEPAELVRTSPGYIMEGISFKTSNQNGPEIQKSTILNEDVWNFGFAFQYRNPPGTDALFIRFQAPNDLNITAGVKLKLWFYDTNDNYPLVIGGKAEYRVILNNTIVAEHVRPKYSTKDISENNYEEVSLSRFIKSGFNSLIIAVDTDNTRFMHLWKAVIE